MQEQYSRRNCLLIHGVKEDANEDTDKLLFQFIQDDLEVDVNFVKLNVWKNNIYNGIIMVNSDNKIKVFYDVIAETSKPCCQYKIHLVSILFCFLILLSWIFRNHIFSEQLHEKGPVPFTL